MKITNNDIAQAFRILWLNMKSNIMIFQQTHRQHGWSKKITYG